MLLRALFLAITLLFVCGKVQAQTQATIQTQIDNACATGGTVTLPPTLTLNSTLNLTCDPPIPAAYNKPLLLKGAPSHLICTTAGSPCIAIGAKTPGTNVVRENLMLSGVNLVGPGQTIPGSVGIRILNSGGLSTLDHIRIDNFEKGLHIDGSSYLMGLINISDIVIGVPNDSTQIAVHIQGKVANVKFINFGLAGWQRILLMDGPAGTGAGISFNSGYFNSTQTPGIPAISVSGLDNNGIKTLNITNVEDWETACPYLELGPGAWVTMNGIGWWADLIPADNNPAIHILPNAISWLKMSDVALAGCTGSTDLIKNESALAVIWASASDLTGGKINFTAAGWGTFVGDRCNSGDGTTSFIGQITNIRSQGNIGTCPVR